MACKLCRFCLKETKGEAHSSHLLTTELTAEQQSVLEIVFGVQIEADDGMSRYACRSCCSTAKRTFTKLQELQEMAHDSYDRFNRGNIAKN